MNVKGRSTILDHLATSNGVCETNHTILDQEITWTRRKGKHRNSSVGIINIPDLNKEGIPEQLQQKESRFPLQPKVVHRAEIIALLSCRFVANSGSSPMFFTLIVVLYLLFVLVRVSLGLPVFHLPSGDSLMWNRDFALLKIYFNPRLVIIFVIRSCVLSHFCVWLKAFLSVIAIHQRQLLLKARILSTIKKVYNIRN